ncbi:MAG: rhamnulose-1-phosphate aldolase [Clostridia bacterium]|nr:rhamnulose-1-phosphate aldolase [Clostridia bacterium]
MKNILEAPFLTELGRICTVMYQKGWHERNGGNISLLLPEEEVSPYLDIRRPCRRVPLEAPIKGAYGKLLLVTGSGKYFRNTEKDPENNLGIIRISEDGSAYDVLWGFSDGGKATSELSSHLLCHLARRDANPKSRVIIHSHPTNIIAMTFIEELSDKNFTHILWRMITECILVFPDGVGVLPWMPCGCADIALSTADKMREYRMVIWGCHGMLAAGDDLDEAFGLIETAEKAAEIYIKTAGLPIRQHIPDSGLKNAAAIYGLVPNEKFFG